MQWRTDWENAPRGKGVNDGATYFLVKLPNGMVTTAYFYWYVEGDHETFKKIEFWALQDAVRDDALDEDGPPEQNDLKWMPML